MISVTVTKKMLPVGANTLAYLSSTSVMKKKSFIELSPSFNVLKPFLSWDKLSSLAYEC